MPGLDDYLLCVDRERNAKMVALVVSTEKRERRQQYDFLKGHTRLLEVLRFTGQALSTRFNPVELSIDSVETSSLSRVFLRLIWDMKKLGMQPESRGWMATGNEPLRRTFKWRQVEVKMGIRPDHKYNLVIGDGNVDQVLSETASVKNIAQSTDRIIASGMFYKFQNPIIDEGDDPYILRGREILDSWVS